MEDPVTTAPSPTRARIATVVIVGPAPRLEDAASVLAGADEAGALRIVLIATGTDRLPAIDALHDVVSIGGLRADHVNNAIAGVRLSSLPTVVWWRGGPADGIAGVAALADRVVMDVDDPWPLWAKTPAHFDDTAFTDVRWARVTRWRAAMAHFFDLDEVRAAAASFSRLTIRGNDRPQCALFAGWLDAALGWTERIERTFETGTSPMASVVLAGDAGELSLQLLPHSTCLDTRARLSNRVLASRVISLGDQQLGSLMSEELRVRSRDVAFERALERALAAEAAGGSAPSA